MGWIINVIGYCMKQLLINISVWQSSGMYYLSERTMIDIDQFLKREHKDDISLCMMCSRFAIQVSNNSNFILKNHVFDFSILGPSLFTWQFWFLLIMWDDIINAFVHIFNSYFYFDFADILVHCCDEDSVIMSHQPCDFENIDMD